MIGGDRDPGARRLLDSDLVDRARRAAGGVLGVKAQPNAVHVSRWHEAIPCARTRPRTKSSGHRRSLAANPGLLLAGNYLEGVGLEAAASSGARAAASVVGGGTE